MVNHIEFAGEEPESLLPDPKDNSVKLNMQQAEELLMDSVKSDVQTFMAHWRSFHQAEQEAIDDSQGEVRTNSYPAELTADDWYQEFYVWMGV